MKNLILGLVLAAVSITGLAGFNDISAAQLTVQTVSSDSQYRYEYKRLNDQWTLKYTYRKSDNRLISVDPIHSDND